MKTDIEHAKKLDQRIWDLLRQQRMELHEANLISNEEYAALAFDHPAVARLETYDQMRAELAAAHERIAALESTSLGGSVNRPSLESLVRYLEVQRDFNEKWIPVHQLEGHLIASARRREVVAELQSWIDALREVLALDASGISHETD